MSKEKTEPGIKSVAMNRKARFNYHILETFEAGLVLQGWEIKSIRSGGVNIGEAYVRPFNGELFLLNAHINPYRFTHDKEVDPLRERKLLMNADEIYKISGKVQSKGFTIVPLEIYLKRGRAKLKIALAKGKDAPDKRETIKAREAKREMERSIKSRK